MANHFSSVGFSVATNEEWAELVDQTAQEGDEIEFDGGILFRWRQESGEEISVLIDDDNNFRGGAPHFAGSTQVEVALAGAFDDSEGFWEGAFYAWMNPPGDDLQSGDYPFVFDVADYWTIKDRLDLPQRAQVQIAAFAHEIEFFIRKKTLRLRRPTKLNTHRTFLFQSVCSSTKMQKKVPRRSLMQFSAEQFCVTNNASTPPQI
jgi:hypothetical protein